MQQVSPPKSTNSEKPLQLLLFVDERPVSRQQLQQIYLYLQELEANYHFELQIIDVGKQPYLAEQFKLIATPALVKIHPEPQQTLAGDNLIAELENWWPRWQIAINSQLRLHSERSGSVSKNHFVSITKPAIATIADSVEMIQLTDEIFHLKREKERLLEQLQFKDRVIAMLAHDLRNPLTAVSIAIETLETNLVSHQQQISRLTPALMAQLFKQARAQARTIDRMITNILQVASSATAELGIQPQKLDLKLICQEVIGHLSNHFHAKYQQVEVDIPNDLPCVYGDQERISQVLTNLLDNAAKYTPEGGTIRIAGLHRTTQKVQLSISDTGPGIPLENRERIFEDRFRLQRDQAKDGYGIGLYLCQRIVLAHYGQIWVDAAPDGGSWFHFTLPVYPS